VEDKTSNLSCLGYNDTNVVFLV